MSLISVLFEHQLAVKMFHFQTTKYGAHKAADAYLITYEANLDRFMEVYQGEYGTITDTRIDISFITKTDDTIDLHLQSMIDYLASMQNISVGLQNIRDEMISNIKQFMYLLTFF